MGNGVRCHGGGGGWGGGGGVIRETARVDPPEVGRKTFDRRAPSAGDLNKE